MIDSSEKLSKQMGFLARLDLAIAQQMFPEALEIQKDVSEALASAKEMSSDSSTSLLSVSRTILGTVVIDYGTRDNNLYKRIEVLRGQYGMYEECALLGKRLPPCRSSLYPLPPKNDPVYVLCGVQGGLSQQTNRKPWTIWPSEDGKSFLSVNSIRLSQLPTLLSLTQEAIRTKWHAENSAKSVLEGYISPSDDPLRR